jgi:hypothetical protein
LSGLLLIINLAQAQINVNSAGNVSLATTIQSGYSLTLSDNVLFFHGIYPGFIINGSSTNCYYGLTLYPSLNNSGNLGKSNMAFSHIYSCYGNVEQSDARQKENVKNIDNALGLIKQLQGVKYDLKKDFAYNEKIVTDEKTKEKFEKQRKNQVGFLAQDVNKVLPEVVVYDDSTDAYGIVYSRVVPVLVEAIKEQQTQIETLKSEISDLKNMPKEKSATIDNTSPASLDQNIPNPFSANTTIKMNIPNTVSRASLYIYNMQGEQIKQIAINERGSTSVTIEGHTLKAGMYLYTLIADGKEVDTKKMILTK